MFPLALLPPPADEQASTRTPTEPSRPSSSHPPTSSAPEAAKGIPRPELAGSRRCMPRCTSVFLVDSDGYRRSVPNHLTYNRLFRGWQGLVDDPDLELLPMRPALSTSVMLIRGELSPVLYLLDHGLKRCIPSPAIMDKYWFAWDRIEVLKQFLVDTIPSGRPWL